MTLAYVFAHRAQSGLTAGTYEDALRRFHGPLASAHPNGFIGPTTSGIGDG